MKAMLHCFLKGRRKIDDPENMTPADGDERDRLIRMKSEGMQAHTMSALIFACMAAWFLHSSAALLFNSLVVAVIVSELARAGWQVFNYNRAI